jgi:hypothetical protein
MGKLDQRTAIKVDHRPLPRPIELRKTSRQSEPGIIHQAGNGLAMSFYVRDQLSDCSRLAEVDSHDAGIAKFGGEGVEAILAAGNQHKAITAGRQLPREVHSEPGRRAGDKCDWGHGQLDSLK